MFATLASFSSLFTSTLVMLLGVGLFNVYMALNFLLTVLARFGLARSYRLTTLVL